jgi:general stress protein CsbA
MCTLKSGDIVRSRLSGIVATIILIYANIKQNYDVILITACAVSVIHFVNDRLPRN